MKNLELIAAIGKNNELGFNNNLIWHIKEDLQSFKEITMNKNMIMGMNTFISIPHNLKGRKYIVLYISEQAIFAFKTAATISGIITAKVVVDKA